MYDAISINYDRFVNWQNRLGVEMPFITGQIQKDAGPGCRVLDAACGTGMHAIALAKLGYQVSAADTSQGMIERAHSNAVNAGVQVHLENAGFESLAKVFGHSVFEAVLCLGNSLPHILELDALEAALIDFAGCLRPRGFVLIQNRNFDAVLAHHERWMEPQSFREGDEEWLFQRFYDFDPDGLLSFHMVSLYRNGTTAWKQKVTTTRIYPQRQDELMSALSQAGFIDIVSYGSMTGEPFDPRNSGNLVITAIIP